LVFLYYSLTSINNQSTSITLPSKHYDTLAELLNLMTTNCNSAFSGYVANMLPALSTGDFSYYRDRGLKMLASAATGNKFSFEYVTSPFSALAVTPYNLSADTSGNWYPTSAGINWTITQTDEEIYLTRGGGCMLEFNINFPTQAEAIANGIATSIGLFDKNGFSLGLVQLASSGVLFLYDINNVKTEIPLASIPRGSTCQIYQSGGYFQLRCFTENEAGFDVEHFNSINAYPQALGSVDFFGTYNFRAEGRSTVVAVNFPAIGQVVTMTKEVSYGATQDEFTRTIALDFTEASSLRAGLNVPNGLLLCVPQNSDFGAYNGTGAMNLSSINSSFDLALEIVDLPLQTYQASSDRKPGSRQNIVCYFRPILSNVGLNSYTYDSPAYQWLDIDTSYPLNLSSLSFRVFNPTTGMGLTASSMTFNLMINTTEY
jgi:hypothetical protein